MIKIAECQPGYIFWLFIGVLASSSINGQNSDRFKEYKQLTKRVYHFTKVEFITEEGEFNEAICTLNIPELKEDSPPYIAIYYKRENSEWFIGVFLCIILRKDQYGNNCSYRRTMG